MQSLTFVTAIINIKTGCREETLQFKMEQLSQFLFLLKGPITIFADRGSAEILNSTYKDRKNITIILFSMEEESWIYKASLPYADRMPHNRNETKDTFLHLCLSQMKIEFLKKAIEANPFNSTHFVWIDPHICQLFHDPKPVINYLNYLSMQTFTNAPFIAMPGCWSSEPVDFNAVCWRFCGNFMLGDAASILNLHSLYEKLYTNVLREKNMMTWDVNMWAHLEDRFAPVWFKANHDASIVRIPTSLYSKRLSDPIIKYKYPEVPGFYPSSASYINNLLFTRYVNYRIDNNGAYTINNASGQIQTTNVVSYLSDDLTTILESYAIDDSTLGIPAYNSGRYVGLEDVRIFNCANRRNLAFVASSASYTKGHEIRIVRGEFSLADKKFINGEVLEPPTHLPSFCEKNWIPLSDGKFIFRWHPYEIGACNGNMPMQIISSRVISNSLFEKVRGSTIPVWSDACYTCVVHWSEVQNVPGTVGSCGPLGTVGSCGPLGNLLQYYHMLVRLDGDYNVIEWSNPFHFSRIGIQYCLGFTIIDPETYGFWFSENDGNPGFIRSCSSQFSFQGRDYIDEL